MNEKRFRRHLTGHTSSTKTSPALAREHRICLSAALLHVPREDPAPHFLCLLPFIAFRARSALRRVISSQHAMLKAASAEARPSPSRTHRQCGGVL